MEGRLRCGFEAYHVTLATICFFVCPCFSGQRATVALKLGVMYEEHLCTVAVTGCVRGFHTNPLASYFLVQSSTALRLLSGEHQCFGFCLDCVEYICLVALFDPPLIGTFNVSTSYQ